VKKGLGRLLKALRDPNNLSKAELLNAAAYAMENRNCDEESVEWFAPRFRKCVGAQLLDENPDVHIAACRVLDAMCEFHASAVQKYMIPYLKQLLVPFDTGNPERCEAVEHTMELLIGIGTYGDSKHIGVVVAELIRMEISSKDNFQRKQCWLSIESALKLFEHSRSNDGGSDPKGKHFNTMMDALEKALKRGLPDKNKEAQMAAIKVLQRLIVLDESRGKNIVARLPISVRGKMHGNSMSGQSDGLISWGHHYKLESRKYKKKHSGLVRAARAKTIDGPNVAAKGLSIKVSPEVRPRAGDMITESTTPTTPNFEIECKDEERKGPSELKVTVLSSDDDVDEKTTNEADSEQDGGPLVDVVMKRMAREMNQRRKRLGVGRHEGSDTARDRLLRIVFEETKDYALSRKLHSFLLLEDGDTDYIEGDVAMYQMVGESGISRTLAQRFKVRAQPDPAERVEGRERMQSLDVPSTPTHGAPNHRGSINKNDSREIIFFLDQSTSMELEDQSIAKLLIDDDSVNDNETSPRTMGFIALFITNRSVDNVCFDRISVTKSNQKTVLLSSRGLSSGIHEWNIEIKRSDSDLQEIGVIGTSDIDRIPVSEGGILDTAGFKARASYGSQRSSGALFYGSYNANGKKRCHRDLRPYFEGGFAVEDVITVSLDLDVWRIKYLLNGEAVRYAMSLERKKTYWPVICFSGQCEYELIRFD